MADKDPRMGERSWLKDFIQEMTGHHVDSFQKSQDERGVWMRSREIKTSVPAVIGSAQQQQQQSSVGYRCGEGIVDEGVRVSPSPILVESPPVSNCRLSV